MDGIDTIVYGHGALFRIKISGWLGNARKVRTACCWGKLRDRLALTLLFKRTRGTTQAAENMTPKEWRFLLCIYKLIDTLWKYLPCSTSYILVTIWTNEIKFALVAQMDFRSVVIRQRNMLFSKDESGNFLFCW